MADETASSGPDQADAPPAPPRVLSRAIYCRRCDYDLRAAPSGRCPECGQPFHRLRPHTYAFRTRAADRRRLVAFMGIGVVALAILAMPIWLGFGLAMTMIALVSWLTVMFVAVWEVVSRGQMIERRGHQRRLRRFTWPRRRW